MKEFIEKLIGRLEDEKKQAQCEGLLSFAMGFKVSIKIVNELAEKYNNGWIPCSQRLPDDDKEVLCWYEYRIMQGTCVGEITQRYGIGWYSKHFKNWFGEVAYGRDCRVIAWQPLPTAYEKGGE